MAQLAEVLDVVLHLNRDDMNGESESMMDESGLSVECQEEEVEQERRKRMAL